MRKRLRDQKLYCLLWGGGGVIYLSRNPWVWGIEEPVLRGRVELLKGIEKYQVFEKL